jgi:N-glycosylase/DNA lyase
MDYIISQNKIIADNKYFNVKDTLFCGQMFRFKPYGDGFFVNSLDKNCYIYEKDNNVIIETEDIEYFINYFDLDNDYSIIINELNKDICLKEILNKSTGIRICNQNPFEMIISFIISQNNNIPRIKMIIERLCKAAGEKKGDFYAFPILNELTDKDIKFYNDIGCGYRSPYIFETIKKIKNVLDINQIYEMNKTDAKILLKSLKGVGDKVADCILLFGYHKTECFPVDVWIEKVYRDITKDIDSNRKMIEDYFSDKYGNYSGYAQQYLFHNKRTKK